MTKEILYGLPNNDYHNSEPYTDYLSSSALKLYLKSPLIAKYTLDNPVEEKSDALRTGSLFHSLMESVATHGGDYAKGCEDWMRQIAVFEPPINEKTGQPYGCATKAYKEAYDAFLEQNQGKEVVEQDEVGLVTSMAISLLAGKGATSAQVRKLLKWCKAAEVSYFYEDESGTKLKIRPDLLTRDKLVDWKTCSLDSLDDESIAKQIIKYRYDVSLSMYQYILHEFDGKWYTPILVFVQKSAPYDILMCDLSEWCYSYNADTEELKQGVGAIEFERLLELHKRCTAENEWPGAEDLIEPDEDTRILKPSVPYWLEMKYFGF